MTESEGRDAAAAATALDGVPLSRYAAGTVPNAGAHHDARADSRSEHRSGQPPPTPAQPRRRSETQPPH